MRMAEDTPAISHSHAQPPAKTVCMCRFHLPDPLTPVNLEGLEPAPPPDGEARSAEESKSAVARAFKYNIDPGVTWDFVPWVRSFCRLPILVKVGTDTMDC